MRLQHDALALCVANVKTTVANDSQPDLIIFQFYNAYLLSFIPRPSDTGDKKRRKTNLLIIYAERHHGRQDSLMVAFA